MTRERQFSQSLTGSRSLNIFKQHCHRQFRQTLNKRLEFHEKKVEKVQVFIVLPKKGLQRL